MAHIVKCKVCEEKFDRDKEPTTKVSGNRYAHTKCVDENYEPPKEEQDLAELHRYLKMLFKDNYNYVALNRQIESFIKDPHLNATYSGILKTLVYWYNIKGNSTEKSNYRIGIVPYVYQDAKNYYYAIFMAQQGNTGKDLEEYKRPKVETVVIKRPQRDTSNFRLFNLDD